MKRSDIKTILPVLPLRPLLLIRGVRFWKELGRSANIALYLHIVLARHLWRPVPGTGGWIGIIRRSITWIDILGFNLELLEVPLPQQEITSRVSIQQEIPENEVVVAPHARKRRAWNLPAESDRRGGQQWRSNDPEDPDRNFHEYCSLLHRARIVTSASLVSAGRRPPGDNPFYISPCRQP